jgi:hypothetical protein
MLHILGSRKARTPPFEDGTARDCHPGPIVFLTGCQQQWMLIFHADKPLQMVACSWVTQRTQNCLHTQLQQGHHTCVVMQHSRGTVSARSNTQLLGAAHCLCSWPSTNLQPFVLGWLPCARYGACHTCVQLGGLSP